MRGDETQDQDRHADRKRAPADPKQLVEVSLKAIGPVEEVSPKSLAQLPRRRSLRCGPREVNDDPDRQAGGQLSCPADDIFLRFLVEIPLSKREWIERVEKLRDIIHADLDRLVCVYGCHDAEGSIARRLPGDCRLICTSKRPARWPSGGLLRIDLDPRLDAVARIDDNAFSERKTGRHLGKSARSAQQFDVADPRTSILPTQTLRQVSPRRWAGPGSG
jgi:hypothetical protein